MSWSLKSIPRCEDRPGLTFISVSGLLKSINRGPSGGHASPEKPEGANAETRSVDFDTYHKGAFTLSVSGRVTYSSAISAFRPANSTLISYAFSGVMPAKMRAALSDAIRPRNPAAKVESIFSNNAAACFGFMLA